jgi:hypothetical protein
MKSKYRIYVLGPIPSDLKERIASIHASAILNSRNDVKPVHTQTLNDQNSKVGPNVFEKFRK